MLIVVTGTTRGLGLALSSRFIENGHTVAGCGRSEMAIQNLSRQFPKTNRFDTVDVACESSVQAWAKEILRTMGPADLLVNNAAVMNAPAPLWAISAKDFDDLMGVNVAGTLNVIRAFLPAMMERGSGLVVNFSSGWGRSTSPEVGPYCASKWAIEGLTGSLSAELPAGLAAVSLNPGIIDTEMLRTCWSDAAASYETAEEWSHRAAPFILGIGMHQNGQALSVP